MESFYTDAGTGGGSATSTICSLIVEAKDVLWWTNANVKLYWTNSCPIIVIIRQVPGFGPPPLMKGADVKGEVHVLKLVGIDSKAKMDRRNSMNF